MRVALATSSDLPELDVDDLPLRDALAARDVDARPTVWDDPDADWSVFDRVVIRSTWDYTAARHHFVAWAQTVGATVPLRNDPAVVEWNTDKTYLRALDAAGVPVVPTAWAEPGAEVHLSALLAERAWDDAVIKPAISAGARGTIRVAEHGVEAAQQHLDELIGRGTALVQPFRPAVTQDGELSVIWIAGAPTHVVRKLPATGDYRVQSRFGGTAERVDAPREAVEVAASVLRAATDLLPSAASLLYARVDLLPAPAGGWELVELEVVEPSLFLTSAPEAAVRLATAICAEDWAA